jgi:tetratricopeptide (TPR) repeat protein
LALLAAEPRDPAGRQRFAGVIRRHLGDAGRAPANWPVVYVQVRQNPQEGLPRWRQLVAEEQRLLSSQQDQTNVIIVAGLLCLQALLETDYCDPQTAEGTFQRFSQILLPDHPEHLQAMVDAAVVMQARGKVDWAETVLSRAIAEGDPRRTLRARRLLAELYYDQDKPLAAAQTLEHFLKLLQERILPVLDVEGTTPGQLRSRMYYFYACHFKQVGNLEEHRRYLELALQQDPENIDALIARAQLPDMPEEFRQETAQLIAGVRRELERLLADSTDPEEQASYLNQLAWLVGNTKGDLDKALAWAQRAVELHPESGAYWDTLAHVYYHRGELEKAVEAQSRAAELEPGSRLIRKQLDFFREALRQATPK